MLAELVAVDEVLGVGHQVHRARLLEHRCTQRRYRVLSTRGECLTDFIGDICSVLQRARWLHARALLQAPPIIQLGDGHETGGSLRPLLHI